MAIFTNFKYFGTSCAIVYKKAKNLQSQVIGFIMLRRPMVDATLFFIINLKHDICKSKNIEERTSSTNIDVLIMLMIMIFLSCKIFSH